MNIRIMTESDLLNLYGTLSDSEVMKYIEAPLSTVFEVEFWWEYEAKGIFTF